VVDANEMAELLITIIGRVLLGARLHDRARETREAVTAVFEWFQRLRFPGGASVGWLTRPSAALAHLDALVASALRSRETPFLAALDAACVRGELSEAELRDEALTFFMGAHETTATALSWTLYLLTQNPEAQDWVAADGAAPARMVFAEALRLFPPAWAFSRRVQTRGRLGELALAPDTIVLLSPFVTQRDPRFFPRPEAFDPLRFSDSSRPPAKLSYFPFGAGGRGCVGEAWAWAIAETLLPLLFGSWRIQLAPDADVSMWPLITLRPRAGMRVRLRPA
jgi:cytochrome P450